MSKAEELRAFIEQVKEENKTDIDRFVNDLKPVIEKNKLAFIENKPLAISLNIHSSYFGGSYNFLERVVDFQIFKINHSDGYKWCNLEEAKNQPYHYYPEYNGPSVNMDGIPTIMCEFCKKLVQEGFELWFVFNMDYKPRLSFVLLVL